MNLQVSFDAHSFKTWLNELERSQLPYAEAQALNSIGYKIQKYIRENIEKKFILRNNWTLKGIQVERATKRNKVVTIGTRDKYLARHEEGGVFRPTTGKAFSIPLKDIKRNKRGIVTRFKWPGRLKGKNIKITRGKRGKIMIRAKKSGAELLWGFENQIKLKPRLGFVRTSEAVGSKFMQPTFEEQFKRAIGSANRPTKEYGGSVLL